MWTPVYACYEGADTQRSLFEHEIGVNHSKSVGIRPFAACILLTAAGKYSYSIIFISNFVNFTEGSWDRTRQQATGST